MGKDRRILGDSPGTIPAAGRQVVHRDPLSDVPDQWLFFGCFGLGAVAIWVLKALGIGQYVVTAVPVCLMIAYAAIAIVTKRYKIRADKIGDNIYYLGFLFTLVSLAYALWSFTAAASATETIITNFGIAIITTIFGLAGRVFFNQMREDPVEYEREARYSLAEATRNLKSQIDDISVELSSFKRGLVQIIEEGVTDISDKASETLLQNLSRFTEVGGAVIGKISLPSVLLRTTPSGSTTSPRKTSMPSMRSSNGSKRSKHRPICWARSSGRSCRNSGISQISHWHAVMCTTKASRNSST